MHKIVSPTRALFSTACLLAFLAMGATSGGSTLNGTLPVMGLTPDPGFPVWIAADPVDYLPLAANQTSGVAWYASDTTTDGFKRDWLVLADDDDVGGLHFVDVTDADSGPILSFHYPDLTLPDPRVAGFGFKSGYDWEDICIHPWTNSFFIVQEGYADEIAVYHGRISPSITRPDPACSLSNYTGEVGVFPGGFMDIRKLNLPGWNETFGGLFSDNMGIEGLACSQDRLFVGLESPFDFNTRMIRECSTILAIWSINPENPSDMENCELLAVHDTADWESSLGFRIETICGLCAIDSKRLVGIDRDNTRMFAVEFDESGQFLGGRVFFLDVPGPAPLESDGCPEIDGLPRLVRPSLESIAAVPVYDSAGSADPSAYKIYLACDPWGPGWSLFESGWDCQAYRDRLSALLPALYRYTVPAHTLFPQTETDLLLVGE